MTDGLAGTPPPLLPMTEEALSGRLNHVPTFQELAELMARLGNPSHGADCRAAETAYDQIQHHYFVLVPLLVIALDQASPYVPRILAAICAKNALERQWTRKHPHPMPAEQKILARQALLSSYQDGCKPLATQMRAIAVKVARYDFPTAWPELLPTISSHLTHAASRPAALDFLDAMLKMLASQALPARRRAFRELALMLLPPVLGLYESLLAEDLAGPARRLRPCTLVAFKCVSRLVLFGFREGLVGTKGCVANPAQPDHAQCLALVAELPGRLVGHIQALAPLPPHYLPEKLLHKMGKFMMQLLEHFPLDYVLARSVIMPCQALLFLLITDTPPPHAFLLLALQVATALVRRLRFGGDPGRRALAQLLSAAQAVRLLDRLLNDWTALLPIDRACWQSAPHDFMTEYLLEDEGGRGGVAESSAEDLGSQTLDSSLTTTLHQRRQIRHQGDTLALHVLAAYRTALLPSLQAAYDELSRTSSIAPEAVAARLHGLALAAPHLCDVADIDNLLLAHVFPMLERLGASCLPDLPILLLRLCEFLETWVPVRVSPAARPAIFSFLAACLAPQQPVLVRYVACRALTICLDDVAMYHPSQVAPVAAALPAYLLGLLGHLEDLDQQAHVIAAITLVLARAGDQASRLASLVAAELPVLWARFERHVLLRERLLGLAAALVAALGEHHASLLPWVQAAVTCCCDLSCPDAAMLLPAAVDLWHVALIYCQHLTSHLEALLPLAVALAPERLQLVAPVLRAYFLLLPHPSVLAALPPLFDALAVRLVDGTSLPETWPKQAELTELALLSGPVASILPALRDYCLAVVRVLVDEASDRVYASSLYLVLARLALVSPDGYIALAKQIEAHFGPETESHLLGLWLDRFDSLATYYERRASLAAWTALLRRGHSGLLARFELVLHAAASYCHDADGTDGALSPTSPRPMTPDARRQEAVDEADFLRRVSLLADLQDTFTCLETSLGAASFAALLDTVHPANLRILRDSFAADRVPPPSEHVDGSVSWSDGACDGAADWTGWTGA